MGTSGSGEKFTVLGQDMDVIVAVFANILSWMVQRFAPFLLPRLLPVIQEEEIEASSPSSNQTKCIAIGRPGGKEQLRIITLKRGFATCGYNVAHGGDETSNDYDNNQNSSSSSPFIDISQKLPPNTVLVRVHAFSINYADCCIRWGLYESANKFVGWPIVPGFDIAGMIEQVSDDNNTNCGFHVGDRVYGATFFGAYSTRVVVPVSQLRKLPTSTLSLAQAAAIPAVSLTALYALYLGGQFPTEEVENSGTCSASSTIRPSNRSILIHSAAGGVGSMLVQMSKLLGLSPVVGVVGRSSKVDAAKALGCDHVIDKSTCSGDLWTQATKVSPNHAGYAVVADANGVSTLQKSFDHLCATGRLIVFGFHSNLPMGQDMLSPVEWLKMIFKVSKMPKFNAMDFVSSNRSMLGFNLSFFVNEIGMLSRLYDQIGTWLQQEKLQVPRVVEMDMTEIAAAHELIQSGKSIGKIVILTDVATQDS